MTHRFADIAFTQGVREHQARLGVASRNNRLHALGGPNDRIGAAEAQFIGARNSFYVASASETGWPYVQHRGGPTGFLRVLDDKTLGFADFRGNAQYISVGNLHHDNRVSLILMDYPSKQRLKILGRAQLVEASDNEALIARLESPDYRARIERAFIITVEAFDWNCPQHITRRFTESEVDTIVTPLLAQINALETQLAQLRLETSSGESF
jgi:uncharacterized protein